jgi:patatin-like phospholipase/acyl hydrolase
MKERFQILSLDGGGIKGLFSAAFMAKLEEDLGINIVDHFDLIVGTSTGGIIALGLGFGLTPKELVEFYYEKGLRIFRKTPIWTSLKGWLFPKYSGRDLESVFREKDCFGEKLLGESKKRLVIPSYNIDSSQVYLFKTAHHERFKRDYKVPAWKIARATSAAPSYFPISTDIDNIRMVDGGVWANNPAMVGLFEAIAVLGVPLEQVRIMSVGTTEELKESPQRLNKYGGLAFWAKTATELIMQAQSVGINMQMQLLLKDHFDRISPTVPDGLFGLDKMNLDQLFAYASSQSRIYSPEFAKKYQEHLAEDFVPAHRI